MKRDMRPLKAKHDAIQTLYERPDEDQSFLNKEMIQSESKAFFGCENDTTPEKVRIHEMKKQKKCLTPGCVEDARCRGLCKACYSTARLRVSSGLNSWEQLENVGLVLPSKAPERTAFSTALEKQFGIEEKARKQHKVAARRAAVPAEREVASLPTIEEFRLLALQVAASPSAESMQKLFDMQERMKTHAPKAERCPSLEERVTPAPMSKSSVVEVSTPRSDLPPEVASYPAWPEYPPQAAENEIDQEFDNQSLFVHEPLPDRVNEAMDVALPEVDNQFVQLAVQEQEERDRMEGGLDLIIGNPPEEVKMSLRERSLVDAKLAAEGKLLTVVEGRCEQDGMSDEEFERIKKSIAIKQAEDEGKTPPPQQNVPALIQAESSPLASPPSFPEPAMPEVLAYDSALDGPAETASIELVPVNPIQK